MMRSLCGVPLHEMGGLGSHRVTFTSLCAIAVPAIATTSAAIVAPTRSTTNLLLIHYAFRSFVPHQGPGEQSAISFQLFGLWLIACTLARFHRLPLLEEEQ